MGIPSPLRNISLPFEKNSEKLHLAATAKTISSEIFQEHTMSTLIGWFNNIMQQYLNAALWVAFYTLIGNTFVITHQHYLCSLRSIKTTPFPNIS